MEFEIRVAKAVVRIARHHRLNRHDGPSLRFYENAANARRYYDLAEAFKRLASTVA